MVRFAPLVSVALLLLTGLVGCGDEPRPKGSAPSGSASSSATSSTTAPTGSTEASTTSGTTSATATATDTATDRISGIAERTSITITKDNQPIDAAGLAAIGWTRVDTANGEARWSDPDLGDISVTWEVPDQRALSSFDVSLWGSVTGQNLAMSPEMSTSVFTGGPGAASAHATDGNTADTPVERMTVVVPEQPVGTTATVSINLGWPQPVLVTYTYTYV